MSPRSPPSASRRPCFPRVSGDEPLIAEGGNEDVRFPRVSGDEPFSKNATTRDTAFSPRERG